MVFPEVSVAFLCVWSETGGATRSSKAHECLFLNCCSCYIEFFSG